MAKKKGVEFYKHQKETIELRERSKIILDLSEPGTGKTLAHCEHFIRHRSRNGGAGLVVCPLSLVGSVWPVDMAKLERGVDVSCAYAKNREKAFQPGHDLYVTNYEGLKYLMDNKALLRKLKLDWLLVDEATAMKNGNAQRTKAAIKLGKDMEYAAMLSGTLGSKSLTDYWAPMMIMDQGKRLGSSFTQFRSAVCSPVQVGNNANALEWIERPGAKEAVAALLADISIRHELEKCHDMPGIVMHLLEFDLPSKVMKQFTQMAKEQALFLKDKVITAVNGGVASNKLLQIASGGVYDNESLVSVLDNTRSEIVADLCVEREHTIVAFTWRHQRDSLITALEKRGRRVTYIDGSVPVAKRNQIVEDYQNGLYDDILLHPQAAAHGLTLTRATTTIWASPTYNYEWFDQLNRRAYRIGQKKRCEVIVLIARNTLDQHAYNVCASSGENMHAMFDAIKAFA